MTFNSLVFPLTVSTTIASAFVISEGRSNFQWNWPMTSQRKIIVPIDTADSSPKVSFEFAKRINNKATKLLNTNQGERSKE